MFTDLTDLKYEVKMILPGKSDNEVLFALRKSARKFMNLGELNQIPVSIDLDPAILEYRIPIPSDTYVQEILTPSKEGFTFDGIDTIIFTPPVGFEIGDTLTFKAILGYHANATDFPSTVIGRYWEGIVQGAVAVLSPDTAKFYNRNFHNSLSEAMSDSGTFKGIKG
jgi:hypothetical protein